MAKSRSIITPMFRVSYANVWTPKKSDSGKDCWSVTAIFDAPEEMNVKDREKFTAMLMLEKEVKEEKWVETRSGKHLPGFRRPFRKGVQQTDENPLGYDLTKNPEYTGKIITSFRSYGRPVGIVGPDNKPLSEQADFYSGCFAIAEITAYAYERAGNKGVAFGLRNLRKVKDGEPLVMQNDPEKAFEEVDMSDYGVDNSAYLAGDLDLIGGI